MFIKRLHGNSNMPIIYKSGTFSKKLNLLPEGQEQVLGRSIVITVSVIRTMYLSLILARLGLETWRNYHERIYAENSPSTYNTISPFQPSWNWNSTYS